MEPTLDQLAALTMTPIGWVRTPFVERSQAPRQPRAAEGVRGVIELRAGQRYEHAIEDLEGWEYLWVLFVFDRNDAWRPKVLPPRSAQRRGLFSTRTPHRPNPIGMSVVRLEKVEGLRVHILDVDMLDRSPVLDIKPYVPWTDAIPNARTGWLSAPDTAPLVTPDDASTIDATARPADVKVAWEVTLAPLAAEQLLYLREQWNIQLEAPLRQLLSLGPHPHPYRRIRRDGDQLRLAHKEWRASARVEGTRIELLQFWSGHRPAALASDDPTLDAHRAFEARWGRKD